MNGQRTRPECLDPDPPLEQYEIEALDAADLARELAERDEANGYYESAQQSCDHAFEVEWPEDAAMLGGGRRWVYRCQECGSVSDEPVPAHLRRYP